MVPRTLATVRAFDLALSLIGLILAAPLLAASAIWIRLDSPGPAVFRQGRVGKGGRVFDCYKLRTMRHGTFEAATHEIEAGAVTRAGRWLRRSKLDELPQLWNVLIGDMSLVGPRPCLASQTELLAHRERLGVLDLRPGITGPAQVAGLDMSRPRELALADAGWRRPSLVRYVMLLLRTFMLSIRNMASARSK